MSRFEGPGRFLELEVMLRPGKAESDGETEARWLMATLGIGPADLLECAYADLLP